MEKGDVTVLRGMLGAKTRPIAEQALFRFLGGSKMKVIKERNYGEKEHAWIAEAAVELRNGGAHIAQVLHATLGHEHKTIRHAGNEVSVYNPGMISFTHPRAAAIEVFILDRPGKVNTLVMLEMENDDDPLVGGVFAGMPYVFPDHRGRGLGAQFHEMNITMGLSLFAPISYSEAGYASRLSAHRTAVLEADRLGKRIHRDSLERYADDLENQRNRAKQDLPEMSL